MPNSSAEGCSGLLSWGRLSFVQYFFVACDVYGAQFCLESLISAALPWFWFSGWYVKSCNITDHLLLPFLQGCLQLCWTKNWAVGSKASPCFANWEWWPAWLFERCLEGKQKGSCSLHDLFGWWRLSCHVSCGVQDLCTLLLLPAFSLGRVVPSVCPKL